ncbi:MAG: hypothetical protein AABW53_01940 [Nanoarchaeota archaeon]
MADKPGADWNIDERASSAPFIILILIALAVAGIVYLLVGAETSFSVNTTEGVLIIVSVIGAVIALISGVAWEFSPVNRLRRALRKMAPLIDQEPSETTKKYYLEIYALYLKMSEKKKKNFYTRVNSLRERIETHLKSEKEIERLFQKVDKGSLTEQKNIYLEIYKAYSGLPRKVQEEYYTHLVQLRDRLERGN